MTTSSVAAGIATHPDAGTAVPKENKGMELAVIQKGAQDFLDFLDESKEIFYAYLYHRTGNEKTAQKLLSEIYIDSLSKALSLFALGSLNFRLLIERADKALLTHTQVAADIDTVYLPKLVWLSDMERGFAATLHDALWTLPVADQRLLILSMLIGYSDKRIADVLAMPLSEVQASLAHAKDNLLTRWEPMPLLAAKLDSLVFVPALDIKNESQLRMELVEKYNALRFRRYQWVILAGLFAVMSNVVVAGVLAFAVITTPSTNLRGTKVQVAALDALLVRREYELHDAKASVAWLADSADVMTTLSSMRDVTELGLGVAGEALKADEKEVKDMNRLRELLRQSGTAMVPPSRRIMLASAVQYGAIDGKNLRR